MKDNEFIGLFKVQSNKLRISDPCYKKDEWAAGTIDDVKVGEWEAHIKTVGKRVAELSAYHADIKRTTLKKLKWVEQDIEVGVDSGQCGIFDEKFYPEEDPGEYGDNTTFYGKCCNLTLKNGGVGVLDFGVVSSSGYGDGAYMCSTLEEKKEVVGVKIVFIEEDNDSDNYDDYEGDDMYPDDYLEDEDY
jgi:hypothetical protein